jgi:hypothetical protein
MYIAVCLPFFYVAVRAEQLKQKQTRISEVKTRFMRAWMDHEERKINYELEK